MISLQNLNKQAKISLAALITRYNILLKNYPLKYKPQYITKYLQQRISCFDIEVSDNNKSWKKVYSGYDSSSSLAKSNTKVSSFPGCTRLSRLSVWSACTPDNFLSTYMVCNKG